MEGLPTNVTPIAWRKVRSGESYVSSSSGQVRVWPYDSDSECHYLIVDVKPRRVLVVPEHDLPPTFDSLVIGYWTAERSNVWVEVPYTIEERR